MIVQPIGKFKLTYANGISQVKLLITQEDYKSIVKPILDNIAEREILSMDSCKTYKTT